MTENEKDDSADQNDSDEKRVGLVGDYHPDTSENIALIQEMRTHKNTFINRIMWIASAIVIILILLHLVLRVSK